ncbi:MAG TPA: CRTAC1 family protein [Chitinophagaceae bacterium]|nr:CRTAC1 family protein [Chitinophagaceae bacterium]
MMFRDFFRIYGLAITATLLFSCRSGTGSNTEMIRLLASVAEKHTDPSNPFSEVAKLRYYDSVLRSAPPFVDSINAEFFKANALLEKGEEQLAIEGFERLISRVPANDKASMDALLRQLAIAYLRLGERVNCIINHSGESCIFPIAGAGIHKDKSGSQKAIELYENILSQKPDDLESRWLLNIAYMTIGGYPGQVPPKFLLKGLDDDSSYAVKPFVDVAAIVGLNTNNMAGGSIVEDFNNDDYLDVITSGWGLQEGMHYNQNNANGSFSDISASSGLKDLVGGLHIVQTDYNNDGFKDIFVLRGGWKKKFGREPNSLLRNNGDGTFTDVTHQSGLLSFHPTQTATWNDFNNDGWLDVFIGNETTEGESHPCELYINNGDGTCTDLAKEAKCDITVWAKGVTSGDYNNDGWPDLFVSTVDGRKYLLKNEGNAKSVRFRDVTLESGLYVNTVRSFPTWFRDYDNDGWLDILVSGYDYGGALAQYAASEALGLPVQNLGNVFLYRNKQDGTFEDVTDKMGLNKVAFAMGSNFGDIDNDGWLDFYLGTGNPQYRSVIPNKMFKNLGGQRFVDITQAARVGNLQKGHGVSFADLDNDGDQDVHIDMGGAYTGDTYQNSLYLNPGQNDNRFIGIRLEGTTCNRAAIGARIKVSFKENGVLRSVYREVNSGSSFGANPLQQHFGIGQANLIESIEIKWPGSSELQVFRNVKAGGVIKIKQGDKEFVTVELKKLDFATQHPDTKVKHH